MIEEYRPLKNNTDDEIIKLYKIADADLRVACIEQPNSDWHSACFAAVCVCAFEMDARGIKMPQQNLTH